ncbi:MAG: P-loop NTPase [Dehalococcoidales bacterium]|nr:P-loop NTPase [Dehalococcoidales bacterium]
MGMFHCPMGAAFYDDEDCIDCGMCLATTESEMVEASKKIRAYLRSHAANKGPIKKIAVCGKGGVGKSTVVNLMANAFRREGYSILVLDTDESNPGLYRMFGFAEQPKPLIRLLSRFSAGQPEPNTEWITRDEIAIQDIPAEYILNRDGLKFLMVGKIEDPFQGCACSMADITRDLMGKLVVKDKEVALVDMEAGIESFGRGVERSVDTIVIIVEPSFESMALAEKIGYMAEGMGIGRIWAILNKVPSDNTGQRMIEELNKRKIKVIGTVYYDPQVSEAGFEGRAPDDSKAMEDVRGIIRRMLDEAK